MAPGAAADSYAETHQYTISIDYSLSRLWVEARFASKLKSITARSNDAGKYLIDVRGCGQDPSIRMRNRRMMLPQEGIDCINYTVDLTTLNVINVGDEDPPAARGDLNYDPFTHNPFGRMIKVGVKYTFQN